MTTTVKQAINAVVDEIYATIESKNLNDKQKRELITDFVWNLLKEQLDTDNKEMKQYIIISNEQICYLSEKVNELIKDWRQPIWWVWFDTVNYIQAMVR